MNKKSILSLSIIGTLGLSTITAPIQASAAITSDLTKPNILVIMTDDESYGNLAVYGGNVDTPYRDSIANNGIRFDNANAVSSVCSPSRYSFMTGRHYDTSSQSGFLERYPENQPSGLVNDASLENDGTNLAEILKANGYNTAMIGKWHISSHELLGNPSKWKGSELQTYPSNVNPKNDSEVNKKIRNNHDWWQKEISSYGFDYVDGVYAANAREFFNKHLYNNNVEYTGDLTVNFLDNQKAEKKPFFLYMSTTYAHGPKPDWKRGEKYPFSFDADPALGPKGVIEGDFSGRIKYRQELKNDPKYNNMSPVARSTKWWDNEVGRVINKLKETGQYENTIIVYVSDHGEKDNQKASLYEGGLEVPMMVQWPAKMKKGIVHKGLASSIDITPTLLDVTNAKLPENMKPMYGKSFKKLFENNNTPYRESLLLKLGNMFGVKTLDWKYLALRYPSPVEKKIENGDNFKGYQGEEIPQPFQFGHVQLSARVFSTHSNYFQRNQMYKASDSADKTNVFLEYPEKAEEMKALLKLELESTENQRPFGEFIGNNKAAWKKVEDAIWFPAVSEKLTSNYKQKAKGKK